MKPCNHSFTLREHGSLRINNDSGSHMGDKWGRGRSGPLVNRSVNARLSIQARGILAVNKVDVVHL